MADPITPFVLGESLSITNLTETTIQTGTPIYLEAGGTGYALLPDGTRVAVERTKEPMILKGKFPDGDYYIDPGQDL